MINRMHVLTAMLLSGLLWAAPARAQVNYDSRIGNPELSSGESFLGDLGYMGGDIETIGDLDGDGIEEIVITIHRSNVGGPQRGAAVIAFMDADGSIKRYRRLDSLRGGVGDAACDECRFGHSVEVLGDLDGDGNPELVVGSEWDGAGGDDPNGWRRGAVWILFLDDDQSVKRRLKIAPGQSGFDGAVEDKDEFGYSSAVIGDVDNDGVPDLAIGAIGDDGADDSTANVSGAVWILFMNQDATVRNVQRINLVEGAAVGAPPLPLERGNLFGECIDALGDLDQNGVPDIAVGAVRDRGGAAGDCEAIGGNCFRRGAVYILLLNREGQYIDYVRITDDGNSGFNTTLPDSSHFGREVRALRPAVGGRTTLAVCVGEPSDQGAIWMLDLDWSQAPAIVIDQVKIGEGAGGLEASLKPIDQFGFGIATVGDVDGDGMEDIFVGSQAHDDGGDGRGTVWRLLLNPDNTVREEKKLSSITGDFIDYPLADGDRFAHSVAVLKDGETIAIGAPFHDGVRTDAGAVYLARLDPVDQVRRVTTGEGGFSGVLAAGDAFGSAVLQIDGGLLVGTPGDDLDGQNRGALWLLMTDLAAPESIIATNRISTSIPLLQGLIGDEAALGYSLAHLGSIAPSGPDWIAVGAPGQNLVVLLAIQPDGSVAAARPISASSAAFRLSVRDGDSFGHSVTGLGDLDQDGIPELAIGAPGTDDLELDSGAVWIVHLTASGEVSSASKISDSSGRLGTPLVADQAFGRSLALLSQDPVLLAVGALRFDASEPVRGAVYELTLNTDGSVAFAQPIDFGIDGLGMTPDPGAAFGESIVRLPGPANRIAVGVPGADFARGSLWILSADRDSPPSPDVADWLGVASPNPFISGTSFRFRQRVTGWSSFEVYDLAGRHIRTLAAGTIPQGDHTLFWDGSDSRGVVVAAGVYMIRARAIGEPDRTLRVLRLR